MHQDHAADNDKYDTPNNANSISAIYRTTGRTLLTAALALLCGAATLGCDDATRYRERTDARGDLTVDGAAVPAQVEVHTYSPQMTGTASWLGALARNAYVSVTVDDGEAPPAAQGLSGLLVTLELEEALGIPGARKIRSCAVDPTVTPPWYGTPTLPSTGWTCEAGLTITRAVDFDPGEPEDDENLLAYLVEGQLSVTFRIDGKPRATLDPATFTVAQVACAGSWACHQE